MTDSTLGSTYAKEGAGLFYEVGSYRYVGLDGDDPATEVGRLGEQGWRYCGRVRCPVGAFAVLAPPPVAEDDGCSGG